MEASNGNAPAGHAQFGSDDHEENCEAKGNGNPFVVPTLTSIPKRLDHTAKDSKDSTPSSQTKQIEDNQQTSCSDNLKQIPVPYTEPLWSGKAEEQYNFEVLKNGSIIDNVNLNQKPYHVFGRLPSCDITLEHPSLSRYHAVVQYSVITTETHEKGWYVYDLDSTHGTLVNKKKIAPKVYHRLRVGYVLKFGGSSRLFILQGPAEDAEEESEMTVTEMKQQKERLTKEAELLRQADMQKEMERIEADKKALEDRGCGWGMADDAEDIEGDNPYASLVAENESLYIDDPKKALKGFYDREGCDLPDYQFTEVGPGKHKCVLDLPVDGPNGEDLVAEAIVSGKRKDAVIACALEACRILDKFGLLRSSTHESRKRKQKKWEDDDFYDSDEDTFLDRTGTIEKKRFQRMKKAGKDEVETYDSLLEKYNQVTNRIQDIESKLQKAKADAEAMAAEEMDELDRYMVSIKSGAMDTKTKMQLKGELIRLKTEEQKLRKLVNIAQPALLPPLKPPSTSAPAPVSSAELLSRKLHSHQKQLKKPQISKASAQVELKPDNYEEQDDEDDDEDRKREKMISERLHGETTSEKLLSSKDDGSRQKRKEKDTEPFTTKVPKLKEPSSSHTAKSVKVKGPMLPPASVEHVEIRKKSTQSSTASVLENLDKQQRMAGKKGSNYSEDPNYAMWLPPEGQTGDGRTSLNEKLGY